MWLALALLTILQIDHGGSQTPPGFVPTTPVPKFAPPYEYRLVNSQNISGLGRVQALYNGTWATVCSTYRWDNNDSNVLCRQLGYQGGVKANPRNFPSPDGSRSKITHNLLFDCNGTEGKLYECRGEWTRYCYQDSTAICYSDQFRDEMIQNITLVTPPTQPPTSMLALGRVELLYRGFWGTICGRNSFGEEETASVCKLLNYKTGMKASRYAVNIRTSGNREPIMWLGQFNCPSVTSDLKTCTDERMGNTTRTHCSSPYYAATMMCLNTTTPYSQLEIQSVRLANITSGKEWIMGRVEVKAEGVWGTVCELRRYSNRDWSFQHAATVCRQLGYKDGKYVRSEVFGKDDKPVLFYNRQCNSDAVDLNSCRSRRYTEYECRKGGAGVFCYNTIDECKPKPPPTKAPPPRRPTPGPGLLPLPPGLRPAPPAPAPAPQPAPRPRPGPVARPAPRPRPGTPGASPGAPAPAPAPAPSRLPLRPESWTTPSYTTRLTTPPLPEMCNTLVRLVGGPETTPGTEVKAGRVEYYNDGLWGPICSDGFDDRDAYVICRSLGYQTGMALMNSSFGVGDGPNWLSQVNCAGNEADLKQCVRRQGNLPNYPPCSRKHQAGVICKEKDEEEEVSVRLIDRNQKHDDGIHEGVVQVLYKGHWGTICSQGWDDEDARVVCRQMGYATGFAVVNSTKGTGMGVVWLEDVKCTGTEKTIADCVHSGWAKRSMYALCPHSNDAGALCIKGKKEEQPGEATEPSPNNFEPRNGEENGSPRNIQSALCVILSTLLLGFYYQY